MNASFTDYALSEKAMEKWDIVEKLRDDVNAALETARADKRIGKSLEACVTLHAEDDESAKAVMAAFGISLAEVFIVSDCRVSSAPPAADSAVSRGTNYPGLTVAVSEAQGEKCERCWTHTPKVGENADHPTLCPRCAAVVTKLPQF